MDKVTLSELVHWIYDRDGKLIDIDIDIIVYCWKYGIFEVFDTLNFNHA